MTAYPKRPKFFANKFVRLLTKKTVANDIGAPACWLLTVIAMTEDARGYTDPVTYYNEQLAPLVGAGSVDALDRVRKKCVDAGWLVYIPGGRRVGAGRYWVTIPERYLGTDDAPTDEGEAFDAPVLVRENAEQTTEQSAEQTASKPRNLLPVPSPVPIPAVAGVCEGAPKPKKGTKAEADPNFARFWIAYPRKDGKKAALKVWAKIAPDDALVATILAAVDRRRRSADWLKDDGRFIPHAATWLHGERWEDGGLVPSAAPEPPRIKRAADNPLVNDDYDYAPLGG